MTTIECYEDINVDGLSIMSRRVLKGTEEDGMEVFEIIGRKKGIYRGSSGTWMTGTLYGIDKYTYEKAMANWKNVNLPKFEKVTNGEETN